MPLPLSSDFDTIVKIAVLFIKDAAYSFCHGWVIFGGGGKIAHFVGFQFVSTMPLPFSSYFDTIAKISVLYIKDEAIHHFCYG